MICLLHGDNHLSSREKLISLINKAKLSQKEIIRFDGLSLSLTQIIPALESGSLFGQEKLIVIENFFFRPKSKEKEALVNYFKQQTITLAIIFWEKKEISGTTLRWLPKTWEFILCKTPPIIFRFLESLRPNNQKEMITLLKQAIKLGNPEQVFYMLIRQIRILILAKDLGKSGLAGAPWQISRAIKQAANFSLKQLCSVYFQLLKIDIQIKTGQSPMPLDWHLDLLLLNL